MEWFNKIKSFCSITKNLNISFILAIIAFLLILGFFLLLYNLKNDEFFRFLNDLWIKNVCYKILIILCICCLIWSLIGLIGSFVKNSESLIEISFANFGKIQEIPNPSVTMHTFQMDFYIIARNNGDKSGQVVGGEFELKKENGKISTTSFLIDPESSTIEASESRMIHIRTDVLDNTFLLDASTSQNGRKESRISGKLLPSKLTVRIISSDLKTKYLQIDTPKKELLISYLRRD